LKVVDGRSHAICAVDCGTVINPDRVRSWIPVAPARAQASILMQPIHVDRPAIFYLVASPAAQPAPSEAAHHALPFFPKSSGKSAGVAIPIAANAATASALLFIAHPPLVGSRAAWHRRWRLAIQHRNTPPDGWHRLLAFAVINGRIEVGNPFFGMGIVLRLFRRLSMLKRTTPPPKIIILNPQNPPCQ
jgi:hypothetical protein